MDTLLDLVCIQDAADDPQTKAMQSPGVVRFIAVHNILVILCIHEFENGGRVGISVAERINFASDSI